MKLKLLLVVLLMFSFFGFAQNNNQTSIIEVDGVCGMCKSRIEKACIKTKGVKMANWNVETQQFKVIYNENKTDLDVIKSNIASVGHDTDSHKATEEAYMSVHQCCRYRDSKITDEHKN